MTNKMPVVAGTYYNYCAGKSAKLNSIIVRVASLTEENVYFEKPFDHIHFPIKYFFDFFEELPKDNLPKNPMEAVMECMEKRIDQIDETRKNFKAQYPDLLPDEETKKEEVNISEVEKALEEVRKELTLKEATEPRNLFKNNNLLDTFFRLHDVAQNLVKALEAEKSKQNEAKAECAKPVSVFRNSNSLSKEEYENCNVLCGKTILYKKGSLEFIKIEDLLDVIEQIQKDFEELKSK